LPDQSPDGVSVPAAGHAKGLQAGVGQSVRLTVRRDGRSISIDTQVTDVSRTS